MEEIWYTLTGTIDAKIVADAILWINGQIYSGQDIKKLKFFLSSIGGDIDSAIRLYDFLKAIRIEVTTIGFGQIDSAANTIFLAGSKRLAVTGCRFFLHEGTYTFHQPTAVLHFHEEHLKLLKELFRRNIQILAIETSKSIKEVEKILQEGRVLNSQEAKKFGIVHEIIEKLPKKEAQTQ